MKNLNLFDQRQKNNIAPLADRMRPSKLNEIVGQKHILQENSLLSIAIKHDQIPSLILWGSPGIGKTTLARVIANETKADFETLSAVLSGVGDLRKAVQNAKELFRLYNKRSILFIDEIHRFNKAQQDALLPHVENGTIILIGATTENPSFAINSALLSRLTVFQLFSICEEDIIILLKRAILDDERGIGKFKLNFNEECLNIIAQNCQGDARRALDILQIAGNFAFQNKQKIINKKIIEQALASKTLIHDKSGESHYNVVSAFIKSMRGSDPDASIYWMMRMIEAGEDPLFILRRMIIFASEDIGDADPNALILATSADTAFQRIGMPEGIYPLSHCCIYLAAAPKSNACYKAWTAAQEDVKKYGALEVPLKLRNAVTKNMEEWGYGKNYRYPHNENGFALGETYLPDKLIGKNYYKPFEIKKQSELNEK